MNRYLLLFTIGIYLAAMALGIAKKQTYTDLTKQEHYLDQLQVAELTEGIAESVCELMQQRLPEAAIILRVEVTGEIEHLFRVDRQRAVIREVYVGCGLEENQEIYIFSDHWKLALDGNPDSMERGFVNVMEVGTEYLVFAESVVEDQNTDIVSVKLCDDFYIAPVFCYEEHQNVVMPITGESTYVSYEMVRDNEFFVASEESLQLVEQLKAQMLALYPGD